MLPHCWEGHGLCIFLASTRTETNREGCIPKTVQKGLHCLLKLLELFCYLQGYVLHWVLSNTNRIHVPFNPVSSQHWCAMHLPCCLCASGWVCLILGTVCAIHTSVILSGVTHQVKLSSQSYWNQFHSKYRHSLSVTLPRTDTHQNTRNTRPNQPTTWCLSPSLIKLIVKKQGQGCTEKSACRWVSLC